MSAEAQVTIRHGHAGDRVGVRRVNEMAFGRPDEAELVGALQAAGAVLLALVAEVDSVVVGHILFSPVTIETENGPTTALGLAPMAVLPEYQRKGIGSRLVSGGSL